MARYRDDLDDDRERYAREARVRRESLGSYDEPYSSRRRAIEEERRSFNNRFGDRAEYYYDEPRYSRRRNTLDDLRGDLSPRFSTPRYTPARSRLRCRDIMTRDLAVATRDTTLRDVATMMKQEDTGIIPVVDYDHDGGNGKGRDEERSYDGRNYSRGKLVGVLTDRDIAIRAVAEGKECTSTRSEEIMSTDIYTARPNDRVVDVIRKMGDKQVRRIPVTNESGYLTGMISMADIAIETHEDYELAEALEEISKGASFWNRLFG